jgi:hypothetical protein
MDMEATPRRVPRDQVVTLGNLNELPRKVLLVLLQRVRVRDYLEPTTQRAVLLHVGTRAEHFLYLDGFVVTVVLIAFLYL